MSFLMYQRSDPRNKDWPAFTTQQIRLRNIIQIIGINIKTNTSKRSQSSSPKPKSIVGDEGSPMFNNNEVETGEEIYFTLHSRPMSAPFYTSDKLRIEKLINKSKSKILIWKEIEPRDISETVRLSTTGCVICIWSSAAGQQETIVSWGVFFQGLHYIGPRADWNVNDFKRNTLIFHCPFGYFTSIDSFITRPTSTQRFVYLQVPRYYCRPSYSVKNLATLHGVQRSVLEEVEAAQQLKSNISLYGYSPEFTNSASTSFHSSPIINEKALIRIQQGRTKLQLKEDIQNLKLKINVLREEKGKALNRISKLRVEKSSYEVNNNSLDLLNRMQGLGREKSRLFQLKIVVQERKRLLTDLSSKLFTRRKQLISELLLIYPITLVEGSKRYSINEVQLPNAEDYGSEGGGQISVSLGYTAHLVAMLSFFLGVPLRYPISHFGSRSRITDHITMQIPDKEREFPLYFRSKEDVYSRYAVYLLNKNVAQLRWYCGLSSSDLRATLPNLMSLLAARLTIPGWPPSLGESLEIAQELTEEVDPQVFRSENSLSLDKGLDQIDQRDKDIENAMLRSSFSDLEGAGGNVVPSGEVRHSRAQDKFLSGWRRKTYESEDIDSSWLINSLNLDFDGGRRLSNSSLSAINRFGLTPMIFLNDDGTQQSPSRRHGRMERRQSGNRTLAVPTAESISNSIAASKTPNENMSQVEKHIKQLERKRSFCVEIGRGQQDARRRHSSTAEAPTSALKSYETEKDRVEDRAADFVRRMSLVEMQLHRKTPDIDEETHPANEKVAEVDEDDVVETEIANIGTENDNGTTVDISERELLYSKPESPAHLSTKYEHPSSGDERGDTPSPSFLRKPSRQQDLTEQATSIEPLKELTEKILNTYDSPKDDSIANGQLRVEKVPFEEILHSPTQISIPNSINSKEIPVKTEVPLSVIDSSLVKEEQDASQTTCDNSGNFSSTSLESDNDDSLWFRTEALVTNSKSFNMVKRRISESN